jgi:hypothetical protein
MTRIWTQLTHTHNRYARSRTTPEHDQASERACDGFIPNRIAPASGLLFMEHIEQELNFLDSLYKLNEK